MPRRRKNRVNWFDAFEVRTFLVSCKVHATGTCSKKVDVDAVATEKGEYILHESLAHPATIFMDIYFPSEPYGQYANPDCQTATEQEHAKATIYLDASTRRGPRGSR